MEALHDRRGELGVLCRIILVRVALRIVVRRLHRRHLLRRAEALDHREAVDLELLPVGRAHLLVEAVARHRVSRRVEDVE